ncbi:MAG: FkbM family methyltransferase [Verrucomicrobia bacterium]|nr:FkbM family methyltransferase [Verrucomicrobiota bacterium]
MTAPGDSFQLNRVFGRTRAPLNVRLTARLRRIPGLAALTWWQGFCDWLALWSLLPHRGAFTYTARGQSRRIPFDGRNAQFEAVHDPLYEHGYEPETSLLLARLCRSSGVFYDIGANWGYFSLLVAAAPDFNGRIHAFEPNPGSRADLMTTVAAAHLEHVISVHAVAIGEKSGTARLQDAAAFRTGLASLTSDGEGPAIEVARLDDLDLPPPAWMKIDVEGAETAVLRGAARILRESRPSLIIENFLNREAHESTLGPLRLLEAAGYRLFVPAFALTDNGFPVLTSYWTHVPALLASQPSPPVHLKALKAAERFLFGHHLNLFACPAERVDSLQLIPDLLIV